VNTISTDALPVGAVFRENPVAPQMVILPAGTYTMGAPETEVAVPPAPQDQGLETQRQMTIAEPFAVGRFAVTRREFQAFVEATNYQIPDQAYTDEDDKVRLRDGRGWRNPGFAQDETHPVVSVSWHDAMAYVAWLSELTGSDYRLLSEPEWEYACRSGSQARFWWGDAVSPYRANYKESDLNWRKATVPVASFGPNRWGLSEMHGNVSEWCSDTWHSEWSVESGRQANEINLDGDDPDRRAIRGGSWKDLRIYVRSAVREAGYADGRSNTIGFRVARTLEDPATFWRKVTGSHVTFWESIWDTEVIPRLPSVTSLGLANPHIAQIRSVANGASDYLGADRLVQLALTRTGFGIEELYGVIYPDDDADTDFIPAGCVAVVTDYRDEKIIVAEAEYLQVLAETFRQKSGCSDSPGNPAATKAAAEIEAFIELLPSLPIARTMPIAQLYKAILRSFSIDDIVRLSMSRRTFQLGPYGCGVGYHHDTKYTSRYRAYVHVLQYHGPGATIPEDRYLGDLMEIFRRKNAGDAVAKLEALRTLRRSFTAMIVAWQAGMYFTSAQHFFSVGWFLGRLLLIRMLSFVHGLFFPGAQSR
jgi:formylglycine-generating enzyme required for sulfatase activity